MKALFFVSAGILGAFYFNLPPEIALMISLGLLIVCGISLYLHRERLLWICTAVLLLSLGFFRTQLFTDQKPSNHISKFTSLEQKAHVMGRIVIDPDIRDTHTYLTIQTDSLQYSGGTLPVCGTVLVKVKPATGKFQYGDYVSVYGYINKPPRPGNPNLFDYREYLGLKGIFAYVSVTGDYNVRIMNSTEYANFVSKAILPTRSYLLEVFSKLPTPGNGALLAGFLLGEKRGLLPEIKNAFMASGTMHLLAVSGSNVALIGSIYFLAMMPVPILRRWKLLGSIPFLVIFSFLANNEPSVVRAVIMATLVILAFILRRRVEPINLAAAAALLILAIYPLWLFDVGFQLSFAAVAGIILCYKSEFYKAERPRSFLIRLRQFLIHSVVISLAAFIVTAPIIAYSFNRIAIYSVLANIPAALLIAIITMMGAVAVVLHPFGGIVRETTLWITDQTINLMRNVTEYFSALPYSNPDIPSPEPGTILIFYLALLFVLTIRWQKSFAKYTMIALLIVLNISVWGSSTLLRMETYNLGFLDADYSDAMFLYSEDDNGILIYAGDGRTKDDLGEKYLKPYLLKLGFRSIPNLILLETGANATKGLEQLLGNGFVEKVWVPTDCRENVDSVLLGNLKSLGFNGQLRGFSSGDELNLLPHIKQIALSPDNNLEGKMKSNSSFPIITTVFNTEILFLGKAVLNSAQGLTESIDLIQFDLNQMDSFKNQLDDSNLVLIETGEPFRYWLEKDEQSSGTGFECHKISREGAIRFLVSETGARLYRN